jgi:mycothiol synthase
MPSAPMARDDVMAGQAEQGTRTVARNEAPVNEAHPSVQMLRPDLEALPPLAPVVSALAPRYRLRTLRAGDEAGWVSLMNTGQLGVWTVDRMRDQLTGCAFPRFDPQGLFVITSASASASASAVGGPTDPGPETVVASACTWLVDPAERETGTLHMVCVLPDHRGHGLSLALCLAVLHRFRRRGFRRVRLNTHDWRLGAIKVYLRLGFQPLLRHPQHRRQWEAIVEALGWASPLTPFEDAESWSWPQAQIGDATGQSSPSNNPT